MSSVPSHQDRLNIWRYAYARSSLIKAQQGCIELQKDRLLPKPEQMPQERRELIVTQIIVSYARPFTNSVLEKGKPWVTLLSEKLAPRTLIQTHKNVIEMRNCAIGHKDAVASAGARMNRVTITVSRGELFVETTSPGDIDAPTCDSLIALCNHLIAYCDKMIRPYLDACFGNGRFPPEGRYQLSTDPAPEAWLQRIG